MDKNLVKTVATLFVGYGKQNDAERIALYCKSLEGVPLGILQKTIQKAILSHKFLPSVAELLEDARELMGSVDPAKRVKPWAEAQKEIQKGISATWFKGCLGEIPPDHPDYGKSCEPMWSTPEIKKTVETYGMNNIGQAMVSDMPTVWAQLRRIYEQICSEQSNREINKMVLSGTEKEFKQLVSRVGGVLK